jgi:hypothetical protein
MIRVQRLSGDDPLVFQVDVAEADGASRHRVTLRPAEAARLVGGSPPERLVEAAFRFLLEREPRDAILARFDLSVISHYFHDFEQKLPAYLKAPE